MSATELNIRRQIVRLAVGESAVINPHGATPGETIYVISSFGKLRSIHYETTERDGVVTATRLAEPPSAKAKADVNALRPGESVVIGGPGSLHQMVRIHCSKLNKTGAARYTCATEDGGLRVTMLADGQNVARQTKYGLERLHHEPELVLEGSPPELQRIRLAASQYSTRHAMPVSCQLLEPGRLRVFRPDLVARAPSPDRRAQALTSTRPRSDKYGLDRLADDRELRFTVPPSEQNNVRQAVSAKARRTGWRIRCRLQDDGSMMVYRADAAQAAE